jgi:hypothetical protein
MLELGEYLAPALPTLVRVRVFVESYQPLKVYPVRVIVSASSRSPEVVSLVVADTAEPPLVLYEIVLYEIEPIALMLGVPE